MTKKSRRTAKARRVLFTLSLVLVMMMVAVGGTIAWLSDETTPVVNTFTDSNLEITLTETTDEDKTTDGNQFKMVPGGTIKKDPKVTVGADSEDCYVFVKVEGDKDFTSFFGDVDELAYGPKWGIVEGDATSAVLYYKGANTTNELASVSANENLEHILDNNEITVLNTVTKTMMDALHGDKTDDSGNVTESNYPTLTFTAYAIHSDYLKDDSGTEISADDIVAVWDLAKPQPQNP